MFAVPQQREKCIANKTGQARIISPKLWACFTCKTARFCVVGNRRLLCAQLLVSLSKLQEKKLGKILQYRRLFDAIAPKKGRDPPLKLCFSKKEVKRRLKKSDASFEKIMQISQKKEEMSLKWKNCHCLCLFFSSCCRFPDFGDSFILFLFLAQIMHNKNLWARPTWDSDC